MPRTRQAVAQKVADRLYALENAIDVALTRAAELNATMPEARGEARLPAMIGQEALNKAAKAFTSLVQARRRVVETHQSLDQARIQIGLRRSISATWSRSPAAGRDRGAVPTPLRAVA